MFAGEPAISTFPKNSFGGNSAQSPEIALSVASRYFEAEVNVRPTIETKRFPRSTTGTALHVRPA